MTHDVCRLVALFNNLFEQSENTRLLSGGDEPLYRPISSERSCAEVVFTQDYFSSALHEVAHWCIAGAERRQLYDYGYWYIAQRDKEQQVAFELAEVKPQALERIFSECAAHPFKPSLDCLQQPEYSAPDFVANVNRQYAHYLRTGLPTRAELFAEALVLEFGTQQTNTPTARIAHG